MCPLTGDDCMEHKCDWYINVLGTHPQSGETINRWGCSMSFLPMLMIENSQQQRSTGAAIESFRNEMVKGNQDLLDHVELAKRLNGGH